MKYTHDYLTPANLQKIISLITKESSINILIVKRNKKIYHTTPVMDEIYPQSSNSFKSTENNFFDKNPTDK